MADRTEKVVFYEFADVSVDIEKRVVTRAGERVQLTPKVFDLLLVLLQNRGEVMMKEELMNLLWPDSFVEESNLTQNVAVLRRTLGDNSRSHKYLLTIPSRGYQFVEDVKEVLGDSESRENAGPPYSQTRAFKWAFATIPLGVLVIAGLAYWLTGRGDTSAAPDIQRTVQVTSWSGLDFYPTISRDGNTIAYSSDRSGSFEIYLKQLIPGAREVMLTTDGGQNFQPAFSPDASMVAYHSKNRNGIWIIPATGGTARQLTDFGSQPAWSPDGTQIAFQSDPLNDLGSGVRNAMPPSTLWTVSIHGGQPRQITQPGKPAGGHAAPNWSPDGKKIIFDANDWAASELWILTPENGELKKTNIGDSKAGADAAFGADGRSIFFVADTGLSIKKVNLNDGGDAVGEPVKLFDASGTRVRHLSVDAAGMRVVYTALATASNIWATTLEQNTTPNRAEQLTKNSYARTVLPSFSPDGRTIAYQSYTTGTIAHLWTMRSDGSDQKQITTRSSFFPEWSADGSHITFLSIGERPVAMWTVTSDGGTERKMFDFDEDVYAARTSPDGKWVAFNSTRNSGTLNIWIVPGQTGGDAKQLTFDKEFAGFPAWSPDGRWIALQIKRGADTHAAVMASEGGDPIQITFDAGQSWVHDWSPDSDKVLFAGQRDGIWNVYSVSRTTKKVERLTDFTKLNSYVRYPDWSPSGDKIAYEYAETTGNVWMVDLK